MNIRDYIEIMADYSSEHYETFQAPTPIPHTHPPYLKNPQKTKLQDTMQDGWRRKDSKRKKKQARRDMKQTLRKTLNQGRPTMVRHAHGGDPNLWAPSQIADL